MVVFSQNESYVDGYDSRKHGINTVNKHPWAWWLGGHPVLVAVVLSTAMCAVTLLFRVSVAAASIFFDVMPHIVSTLNVDRENESGLSTSFSF